MKIIMDNDLCTRECDGLHIRVFAINTLLISQGLDDLENFPPGKKPPCGQKVWNRHWSDRFPPYLMGYTGPVPPRLQVFFFFFITLALWVNKQNVDNSAPISATPDRPVHCEVRASKQEEDSTSHSFFIPFWCLFYVFVALSTVFHSINSPDNSPFSHSVLPVSSLPDWSF